MCPCTLLHHRGKAFLANCVIVLFFFAVFLTNPFNFIPSFKVTLTLSLVLAQALDHRYKLSVVTVCLRCSSFTLKQVEKQTIANVRVNSQTSKVKQHSKVNQRPKRSIKTIHLSICTNLFLFFTGIQNIFTIRSFGTTSFTMTRKIIYFAITTF